MIGMVVFAILAEQPAIISEAMARNGAQKLVIRLVDAATSKDEIAFNAIAPKASFGVNDVGFPMSVDVFSSFPDECQFTGVKNGTEKMTFQARELLVVDAEWKCPAIQQKNETTIKIKFLVDGDHVVSGYMMSRKNRG